MSQETLQQLRSLVSTLATTARDAPQYWLLRSEEGVVSMQPFDTIEQLQIGLMAAISYAESTHADVYVWPMLGWKLSVTGGPLRHLLTPHGSLPLFTLSDPVALDVAEDGFIGTFRTELSPELLSVVQQRPAAPAIVPEVPAGAIVAAEQPRPDAEASFDPLY
jgi:hypothetical protein